MSKRKQKHKEKTSGFLILFLVILLPLVFKNIIDYPTSSDNQVNSSLFRRDADDFTAYQKTTIGIQLSVNSESAEGLTAIPGIGESLARTIVDEREKRRGYKDLHHQYPC